MSEQKRVPGRRIPTVLGALCAVVLVTACTPTGDDPTVSSPAVSASAGPVSPSASASEDPSASPTPFVFPEAGTAPGELAFYRSPGSEPGVGGEGVTGPGLVAADRAFRIEGACEGQGGPFRIQTTNPDDAGRVLMEGRIDCDAPDALASYSVSTPYAGGLQIMLVDGDRIDRVWLRVVQDPA